MCLLLVFSAELFFLSDYQLFIFSMLLFHADPFQAIGNFAIDLTQPGSDLEVFGSSYGSLIILVS